jgi:molybdopterin synthase catalytic subunit
MGPFQRSAKNGAGGAVPNRSVAHLTTEQPLRSDELLFFRFVRCRHDRTHGLLHRQPVDVGEGQEGHAAHSRGAGTIPGMSRSPRVRIQTHDFDLAAEVAALRAGDLGVGAVASFVGTVRERSEGETVHRMELEHYPGMTEAAIEAMIDEALHRFDIRRVSVVHRVGPLELGDQIVLVAVSSAHRGEAFQACEFLMDYLKTQAPFWKKEHTAEGARWVDARVADDEALRRWGIQASNAA